MSADEVIDDELTPPRAERVAKRALVLASCACRASLEEAPDDPIAQDTFAALQDWIPDIGIRDEFENSEWTVITTPLGKLTDRQIIDMGWRAEGMAVLAWALSRIKLPAYDEKINGPEIGGAINFLEESARELVNAPTLRSHEELEWMADLTMAVHWRLRQFDLNPSPLDFVKFAGGCQWARIPIDDLQIKHKDLSLRGKPIYKVSADTFQLCYSIARERQQAANWLIGTERIYSEVTCDT